MPPCTTWRPRWPRSPTATLQAAAAPALLSFWGGARRFSRLRILNPRTGEQVGPVKTWPGPRRASSALRIVDPRTGLEVLPKDSAPRQSSAPRPGAPPGRARSAAPPAPEVGRDPPSAQPRSAGRAKEGARTRSPSFALEALQQPEQDIDWTLELPNGSYWDWPLSREEKKMRVQMLDQVALMDELERLRSPTSSKRATPFVELGGC